MSLLSQVVGVLAAGALVLILLSQAGVRSRHAVGAVALVPIVLAGAFALPMLREAAANLLAQRQTYASLTVGEAQLQGGIAAEVDVAFISWAEEHFSAHDTFHLIVGSPHVAAVTQWASFQLAPHLVVGRSDADWLIFYDSRPALYHSNTLHDLDIYSPRFAVARGKRAR